MTRPDAAKIADPVTRDPETRFHLWYVGLVWRIIRIPSLHVQYIRALSRRLAIPKGRHSEGPLFRLC